MPSRRSGSRRLQKRTAAKCAQVCPMATEGSTSEARSSSSAGTPARRSVGGDFTTIGGQSRNKLAKISGTTGDVDVQFDAHVSGGSNVGPDIFDIVPARSTLFVVGDFSSIGGAARNNVAALNPPTGAEMTGFNPNVTGGQRPQVFAIVVTDDEVYIGGSFLAVRGQSQGQTARRSKTAALTPCTPRIRALPGEGLALAVANSTLYAGGLFFEMDGRPRMKYAQFTEMQ